MTGAKISIDKYQPVRPNSSSLVTDIQALKRARRKIEAVNICMEVMSMSIPIISNLQSFK